MMTRRTDGGEISSIWPALVAGCLWLFNALSENAKLEDCLMSGRTNCNPVQTSR